MGPNDLRAGMVNYVNAIYPCKPLVARQFRSLMVFPLLSTAWCGASAMRMMASLSCPFYVGFVSDLENRTEVAPFCVKLGEDDLLGLSAITHYEQALRSKLSFCATHITH